MTAPDEPWQHAPEPEPPDLDRLARSRNVALLADAGRAVAEGRDEPCPHPDSWFSRVTCPEPCGAMHDHCTECGVVLGYCQVQRWVERPGANDTEEESDG